MSGWSRVVVGVDGSAENEKALRWAYEEAQVHDAELLVVGVARPVPMGVATPPYGGFPWEATGSTPKDMDKVVETVVKNVLGDAVENVRVVAIEGPPAHALIKSAEGADLLVVGSRGAGAFAGMLLGSVSLHAAMHAPCPVTVVR